MLLWRYIRAEYWDDIVADPRLPVTRIAAFDDAFECSIPEFSVHAARPKGEPRDDAWHEWMDRWTNLSRHAARQRRNFASCWFSDEHESIAMWRLFVPDGPGIALAVYYTDLQALLPPGVRMGPVQYARFDDPSAQLPLDRPELWPFLKLSGYRHEQEVRIVVPHDSGLVDTSACDDESRGRVRHTNWLSAVHAARVFTPKLSLREGVLEKVRAALPEAEVLPSKAHPPVAVKWDDSLWVLGYEPVKQPWMRRVMEPASLDSAAASGDEQTAPDE